MAIVGRYSTSTIVRPSYRSRKEVIEGTEKKTFLL